MEVLRWNKVPGKSGPCPLAKLSYRPLSVCHDGEFFVGCSLSAELWTWRDGWINLVSTRAGENVFHGSRVYELSGLVSTGEALYAVGNRGEVLRWDGRVWHVEHGVDGKLFRYPREESLLCYDANHHRIVVWGGTSESGRPGNDTYLFDVAAASWNKLKRGPKPQRDFEAADAWVFVHPLMVYDTAGVRVLRIGYEDFWSLNEDRWEPINCADYQKYGAERDRAIAYDGHTNETLILDFQSGNIIRMGVQRFELLGKAELPPVTVFSGNKGLEARSYQHTWIYVPETRRLEIQNVEANEERFSLDLSPAFDFAARSART